MQRWVCLVMVLALALTGCVTPVRVAPVELARLDGFQAGDEVVLPSVGRSTVVFRQDTKLGLYLRNGDELAHTYDKIEIIDDVFYGVVAGTDSQVAVSLQDVGLARVWPSSEGEYPEIVLMIATVWLAIGLAAFALWAVVRYVEVDDVHIVVYY